ncbi:uncharacterized protein [Palaemon carinicauda]|uniref:uncharacterized protein n=1 Tax=Palaemon carinicauda TaxID=392227 RepID=UPI0035B6A0C1
MRFLFDTGASCSLLPRPLSRTLSRSAGTGLVAPNRSAIPNHGYEILTLSFGSTKNIWKFLIADVTLPILGANFLLHFHLLVDVAHWQLVNTDLHSLTPLIRASPTCSKHQRTHGFLRPPSHIVLGSFPSRTLSNTHGSRKTRYLSSYQDDGGPSVYQIQTCDTLSFGSC